MKSLVLAKLKAAAVHGLVTALVAALSAVLVFYYWYPSGLAAHMGGSNLYLLVVAVELSLGPLISLVIFNPGKSFRHLRRDYCIVALIQFSALAYGLHSTFVSRPVYQVFVIDQLLMISAIELDEEDVSEASSDFDHLPWRVKRVCVEQPADPEEKSDLIFSALAGKDVEFFPKYYRECEEGEVLAGAYPGERLYEALRARGLEGEFAPQLPPPASFSWLPVKGRFGYWVQIYPGGSLESGYYLDFNPFS